MAIKVMSRVWDTSSQSGTDLLTALALADRADEDGVCWPGIKYLAEKTRSSERQAQRNIAKLEERGEIYVSYQRGKGGGRGNTNLYLIATGLMQPEIEEILMRRFGLAALTASRAAKDLLDKQALYKGKGVIDVTLKKKGDIQGKRVTSRAQKGDIAMSPDSSKNPSLDTPGGVAPKKIQLAPIPAALAELCKIKPELMTNGLAHEVQESTALLDRAGVTPAQIRAFGRWWYARDWRGKRGEAPKPRQVCEEWGQFEGSGSGNGSGKRGGFTPAEIEAIRAREQESARERR